MFIINPTTQLNHILELEIPPNLTFKIKNEIDKNQYFEIICHNMKGFERDDFLEE